MHVSFTTSGRARQRWRAVLLVLAAAILTLPVALAVDGARAAGPDRLPMTFTNNTGRDEPVYLYVLGVDLASGSLGYVDAAGTFTPWSGGTNPPSPAPDVSIPGPASGATTTVAIPRRFSGRVYFSFGEKLHFGLTPDGLVQPAPWSASDPNHDILFDWSELTYNDAGLWLNSSQVDMFAVPHAVSVTGADGTTGHTGAVLPGGRQAVIDGVSATPEWAGAVHTRADGTVLRVLSPGKAAGAGLMAADYLEPYIAEAWAAYTDRTLTVVPFGDQPGIRFSGRTSGTTMTFTDTSGAVVATFERPSSADVWGCDGALLAPNDQVVGPIARTLCAALFRGTLGTLDTQPGGTAADFYRSSPPNVYGRLVHEAMADGRAYAFPFDDVAAQESLVHSGDPVAAGIELSHFVNGSLVGDGGSGGDDGDDSGGSGDESGSDTVSIVSDWNGRCVTAPSLADGQRLVVADCADDAAQQWTVTADDALRSSGDLCMDVAMGATANGTAVQLATCTENPAQDWVLTDGMLLNPQAARCLDITDWNPDDGAPLQLWDCAGSANQRWTLR